MSLPAPGMPESVPVTCTKEWQFQVRESRLRLLASRQQDAALAFIERLLSEQTRMIDSKRWILGNFLSGKIDIFRRNRRVKPIDQHRATLENLRNHPAKILAAPDEKSKAPRPVVVVIPIFNAYDEVRSCIDTVLASTPHPHEIFLIDDASNDPRIPPLLANYAAAHPHIFSIRNPENLGYTNTANLALALAAPSDVILLNSDTLVTPRWLEKITACAYSQPNVAAVTAISNAAGNFSFPVNKINNELPENLTPARYAAWVEKLSFYLRPAIQSGNGFCFFLRRSALDKVGFFDSKNFPRGYGEENDFCMRAWKAGFISLVDDTTFIYHKRTASFGAEKETLLQKGASRLKKLHPEYKGLRGQWLNNDPLDRLREVLKAEPWRNSTPSTPAILTIVHGGGGGTRLTTEDLLARLALEGPVYLLETGTNLWTLFFSHEGRLIPIRRYHFSTPWHYYEALNEERTAIWRELLTSLSLRLVHFRHLIGNGAELLLLTKQQGLPIVLSLHDFYTVCPTFTLLDETNTYCGGKCTETPGECSLPNSWFAGCLPTLKHGYVYRHREKIAAGMAVCDAFVTTSRYSGDLLAGFFPGLTDKLHIIEHGRDLAWDDLASAPLAGKKIAILCPGHLTSAKGLDLILQLLSLDRERGQHFEFHFLGSPEKNLSAAAALGGIVHGRYDRENLPRILGQIRPSFAIIGSIWPETYCHTLTESWAAGIPVFASNVGTLRERVEKHGGGWLLDYTDPEKWYRQMVEIVATNGAWEDKKREIEKIPRCTVDEMSNDYQSLYKSVVDLSRAVAFTK